MFRALYAGPLQTAIKKTMYRNNIIATYLPIYSSIIILLSYNTVDVRMSFG